MAAKNTQVNKPNGSGTASPRDGGFREWLLERPDLLLGAYLSALVVLAYPVSLVTLWIQLAGFYGFDYWMALYAASLVPATFVVGKIITVVFFSFITSTVVWYWCMYLWGYRAFHRAGYSIPGNPLGLEDPDKPEGGNTTTIGQSVFSMQRFTAIGLTLTTPTLLFPLLLAQLSWFNTGVYAAYLLLVVLGSFIGVPLLAGALEDESSQKLYKARVVLFTVSVLAAVPLAGLGSPALPTAELDSGERSQTVSLLSHSAGYWHVIDQNSAIVHIPDDDVEGDVPVSGVVEKPGY